MLENTPILEHSVECEKTCKKLKKVVDKLIVIWYYVQVATRDRHTRTLKIKQR